VRPLANAPVSIPIEWDELTEALFPQKFNLKNAIKRLEQKGDLFNPLLSASFDMEKALKKLENIE
jgi:bifunctional non-homologous end joining protein LigD